MKSIRLSSPGRILEKKLFDDDNLRVVARREGTTGMATGADGLHLGR
jgi:hypothetical protein